MKQFLEIAQVLDTQKLKFIANYLVLLIEVRETDITNDEARQLLTDLKQNIIGKQHETSVSNRKEPG